MSIYLFGIRHHGPGSARSLRDALASLRPDAILIEGPPDAESVLPLFAHEAMTPPVALLIYAPDDPKKAVFYPFAEFSPEWQAARYGLRHSVPVRFMDLPQTHQFALAEAEEPATDHRPPITDPLSELSDAAGRNDGEGWWEQIIEQRRNSTDVFAAIAEAMTALREHRSTTQQREALREAFMRQTIRAAQKEGYENIAVVCGAWHVPALQTMPAAKEDAALLKGLPKVKVAATWIPWTNGRLSYDSGYGAGIDSPGWYSHLWNEPEQTEIRWMTKVARLLRDEDLDASSASVIEAVRLAETLAAMRGKHRPGLLELNEATQTVLCFGNDVPLRLIHEKLIVGEVLGQVPDDTPAVPLQQDLQREQKRLRFPAAASQKTIDLDLRKENDLARSQLLHRLSLLGIAWGELQRGNTGKGTFHELWRVQWQPEFSVALIEAGAWGNTVLEAATSFVKHKADNAKNLAELTALVEHTLLADLPAAVAHLMTRIQSEAAVANDIAHLLEALPPLANVLRYGNVRQTDTAMVGHVVDGLVARICVGLPNACASLNDDAAAAMYEQIVNANSAISLLQNQEQAALWQSTLQAMSEQQSLHGLVAGRCCRLLFEAQVLSAEETARRLSFALSTASDPAQAAAWIDGFLRGSGLLLLHDEALWQVLDEWVVSLSAETFTQLLPLVRRTFATFPAPERRQMGERVAQGASVRVAMASGDFDVVRAEAVLPLVKQLLGL
jgi:hypothetical protein